MEIGKEEASPAQSSEKCMMMGRYDINKSACFLALSIVFLVILLINNLFTMSYAPTEVVISRMNENGDSDVSYGIIIDAGSTGSRLFLYSWRSSSDQELIDIHPVNDRYGQPVVKKVAPGLSSFSENPSSAAEYIRPLIEYAGEFISSEKHSMTPIFIFATAGMRLLDLEKQNGIIKSLQQKLPSMTKFQVLPQHIQVISGKWEGIYSWIGVNYMLGRFRFLESKRLFAEAKPSKENLSSKMSPMVRPATAGMIDMGGASAQIAFELPPENKFSNENVQVVNLGCRDDEQRFLYQIFVTTFLGFGVNEGQKKYEQLLEQKLPNATPGTEVNENASSPISYIKDGCLPKSFLKIVTKDDGTQFVRKGNGNWDSCVEEIAKLLFKAPGVKSCSQGQSCFFGGVEAPPVSLSQIELYGFSEYWYSVEDVLSLGGVYIHDEFERKAKSFCSQKWPVTKEKFSEKVYPKANEERLETQCFKSAWIHAILHNGFYVDEVQHHFQSAFKIKGEEVQWALGAMIYQMRYFPLLGVQRQELALKRLHNHFTDGSAGWTFFYLLAILVLVFVLYSLLSKKYVNGGRNSRGMRRDNSIWGYMMLSQNDQEYSFGSSSKDYRINQLSV